MLALSPKRHRNAIVNNLILTIRETVMEWEAVKKTHSEPNELGRRKGRFFTERTETEPNRSLKSCEQARLGR
jgi:hypothetical protein